jgi:phosphoadenosine phosphosulfate reductase
MEKGSFINAKEEMDAFSLLKWADEEFGESAIFACSFGAEDMVIVDILHAIDAQIQIATLDTGRLNRETYDVMEEAGKKYGIRIRHVHPDHLELEKMTSQFGPNLFFDSVEKRKMCCHVRKVEPLNRLLSGKRAWITGIRRDQIFTRSETAKVSNDVERPGIVKIAPLADWTEQMVWSYIREKSVPYNRLYDRGYRSIGCEPCTRAVSPGEDPRAGRWYWEDGIKECGLHPGLVKQNGRKSET